MSADNVEEGSEMECTSRDAVKQLHPKAFAFQWTGYWRIYRDREAMMSIGEEGVLGGPTKTEDTAWAEAERKCIHAPDTQKECTAKRPIVNVVLLLAGIALEIDCLIRSFMTW